MVHGLSLSGVGVGREVSSPSPVLSSYPSSFSMRTRMSFLLIRFFWRPAAALRILSSGVTGLRPTCLHRQHPYAPYAKPRRFVRKHRNRKREWKPTRWTFLCPLLLRVCAGQQSGDRLSPLLTILGIGMRSRRLGTFSLGFLSKVIS